MIKPFKGKLAEYREERISGLLMDEDDRFAKYEQWTAEDIRKLDLLCQHFNIAAGEHSHTLLAIKLAELVVPAFQVKQKEGRRSKWGAYELSVLGVEVERLTDERLTIDGACKVLSQREPWKSFLESWDEGRSYSPDPAEALRSAYKVARKGDNNKRWLATAKEAYLYHLETGSLDVWDAKLLEDIWK
jgi:hypothetical protein